MQERLQHTPAMEQATVPPVPAHPTALDPPAYLCCGGTAMLPARAFADWLGAELTSEGKEMTLAFEGHSFAFAAGEARGEVDGQSVDLAKTPRILGGRTYVPLRPLVEGLGGAVTEFDAADRTATVTFGKKTGQFKLEKRSPCPKEEPPPSEDAARDWWKLPGKPSDAAVEHRQGGCTMIGVRCSYVGECGG